MTHVRYFPSKGCCCMPLCFSPSKKFTKPGWPVTYVMWRLLLCLVLQGQAGLCAYSFQKLRGGHWEEYSTWLIQVWSAEVLYHCVSVHADYRCIRHDLMSGCAVGWKKAKCSGTASKKKALDDGLGWRCYILEEKNNRCLLGFWKWELLWDGNRNLASSSFIVQEKYQHKQYSEKSNS